MALPEGPQSRAEQYLAKIAGQAASLPEAPRSRVEQYLDYIAENGTVSEEEIAEQVSDWLEENIHEDPTVVIDSSLSVSGAAADAKATGDEIADLKADLSESVSDLKSAINSLESTVDGMNQYDGETTYEDISSLLESGGYYTLNGGIGTTVSTTRTSYNGAASMYKSVEKDDMFVLTGSGGNGARLYAFTDTDFKIVEVADSNASYTDQTLTAPADGYLFVNVYTNRDYSLKQETVTYKTLHEEIEDILESIEEISDIADELDDLSATVSDMNSYDALQEWTDISNQFVNNTAYNTGGPGVGGTVTTPASYNSTAASLMYAVSQGDRFKLTGHGGGNSRLWCFTDESKKVLSVSNSNISETAKELTASADGYLFVNVYMSDTHSLSVYSESASITLKQKIAKMDSAIYGRFGWEELAGKNIAIIGDSISTNGDTGTDHNVYEIEVQDEDVGVELSAYLTYYDVQGGLSLGGHTFTSEEIGTEVTFTPVAGDIGKKIGKPNNYNGNSRTVWWEVMQEKFGNKTIPVCWSGSSITSHESGSSQFKTAHAWHTAQIRKCGIRTPGTMTRIAPDMVIIYRGTNDFSHSPYTLLTDGYFNAYNWEYPTDDTVTGGYGYEEGLALTIKKLREAYPETQIYLCTMNVFKRINSSHFPTNNGINSLPQYNDAIRRVADFFGCGIIEFDKDGITFENMYSGGYITESNQTHPTDKGHAVMGRKAIADIMAQYNVLSNRA